MGSSILYNGISNEIFLFKYCSTISSTKVWVVFVLFVLPLKLFLSSLITFDDDGATLGYNCKLLDDGVIMDDGSTGDGTLLEYGSTGDGTTDDGTLLEDGTILVYVVLIKEL